mmetsp:Transcript_52691/g.127744  ORF Transcript_52691/g.127744 Transcript_52691/m.127744 type:complete len:104 (+) Transcript_52691:341-652(+)
MIKSNTQDVQNQSTRTSRSMVLFPPKDILSERFEASFAFDRSINQFSTFSPTKLICQSSFRIVFGLVSVRFFFPLPVVDGNIDFDSRFDGDASNLLDDVRRCM